MQHLIQFFYVGFGIFLLYLGGNLLLKSSVSIATYLKVPTLLIGVTIVSFSTSAPELFTSLVAAFKGKNEIVVSNVIGSNIINMLLALPLAGFFLKIKADFKRLKLSFMFLFLLMFLLLLLSFDFRSYSFFVTPYNRFSSFSILILFLSYLLLFYKEEKEYASLENSFQEGASNLNQSFNFIFFNLLSFAISMYFLYLGSKLLVDGALYIANNVFNVSEKLIGIILVAFGTSVPELVVSLFAIIRKESDIAFGNIIGSNIFNIGFILASSSFFRPILLQDIYILDFSIMVFITLVLFLVVKFKGVFGRGISLIFLLLYFLYNLMLFNFY
ncbi:calcium/sodium antiporter [Borreliella burgdorferi]|uniref:calcium/sodium antiporter n=1 Tax=Borreliella burgdorferi TaxID=139 RepID=UPI00016B2C4D|nr:calcium/sodium antiporter [Borreliella burgdorferi]ADQ29342.1 putative K+-dependent Na+/Ca+ exchanger-like protein [Borreliella burgdorferi N40]ADQ30741.1 putative K+-dependent Na+/Ca+ exchanger-like protein [Borreliella burgdorferi JD1]EEC22122.1 putative K+-dependent Na+/Ca+ exchanger homolog [Borreliella burgdorferi 156a]EEE18897.1 K+-dependent Na+/Ca+ exchanger homolog [Borreliella burgdorferi 72a]EEF56429.1 K+-dependent Na+/Ca+ exchanger homolog [Borreliella burgdorferi 64b]